MSGIYRGAGSSIVAEVVNLDGDRGDITLANSGTEWSIDPDAVTFAKMQNVATDVLLGRATAGSGDVEEIPCTLAGRELLNDTDASAQRTTLGLGTASVTDSTDYATAVQGVKADTALQPADVNTVVLGYDANLKDFADTFTFPATDGLAGQALVTDGAGNIIFGAGGGGGNWGDITGTLSNQTDLQAELDLKATNTALANGLSDKVTDAELTSGLATTAGDAQTANDVLEASLLATIEALPKNLQDITDLGFISGAVSVSFNTGIVKGDLNAADVSISLTDQIAGKSVTCFFYNSSGTQRTVTFATAGVTFVGTVLTTITIPPLMTGVFTIQTNDGITYFCFVNVIQYQIAATGLNTTWNPSDKHGDITLTNGNKTIEKTGTATGYRSSRAFGGKTSGKWRLALRIDVFGSGGISQQILIGVADAAALLSTMAGSTATGYALMVGGINVSQYNLIKVNNGVYTTLLALQNNAGALGAVFGCLIDLDANKIWFTRAGVVIGGGDPEAGTGQDFNLQDGVVLFPICSIYEGSAASAGVHTLLNEVEDPFVATWPSFQNWTA